MYRIYNQPGLFPRIPFTGNCFKKDHLAFFELHPAAVDERNCPFVHHALCRAVQALNFNNIVRFAVFLGGLSGDIADHSAKAYADIVVQVFQCIKFNGAQRLNYISILQ